MPTCLQLVPEKVSPGGHLPGLLAWLGEAPPQGLGLGEDSSGEQSTTQGSRDCGEKQMEGGG